MVQRSGVGKVRHLDIRILYTQSLVKNQGLRVLKCGTDHNKADLGTKSHAADRFEELAELATSSRTPSRRQIQDAMAIFSAALLAGKGEPTALQFTRGPLSR